MIEIDPALIQQWVLSWMLPLFRLLGLFTSAPVLSQRGLPARVRIGLAIGITLAIGPQTLPADAANGFNLIALVVRETVLGLMMGFLARVLFSAFELAGETIGLQMGLSFAGFFDPQSGTSNPVARIINLLALTSFVAMNGHGMLIATVVGSFQSLPITSPGWGGASPQLLIDAGVAMFSLALHLALPFMVLLLFMNLALGVMARVAPQFSIFAIGFPATIGAGLILLALAVPLLDGPLGLTLDNLNALLPIAATPLR